MLSRFGLGTAQFGMTYGKFNRDGIPTHESALQILNRAKDLGLSHIDTAHQYGDSESVLGACGGLLNSFSIITKTPRFSDGKISKDDVMLLREAYNDSLKKLNKKKVDGLLIHHAPNLLQDGGQMLYEEMLQLKTIGKVKRIGVSAYEGEIIEKIHEKYPIDFVQLPINLLDRRLINNNYLKRIESLGIKIHARSAFLQGLILANTETLPPHFNPVKELLNEFHNKAKQAGVKPVHAALHYLLRLNCIECIIVGVDTLGQLDEIFTDFPVEIMMNFEEFEVKQVEILNPVLWMN